MPTLARIVIFPIKSLDGVATPRAEWSAGGGLRNDRRFALLDGAGAVITGKRNPAVHLLQAEFDLAAETVRLCKKAPSAEPSPVFHWLADQPRLAAWLSDYFQTRVSLVEDRGGGFPDDTAATGPTVVSVQSLQAVGEWFGFSPDEARRRFRANLEIDADAPFWEDRLFRSDAQGVAFRIGEVSFLGTYPCARCVVPSRGADTGLPTPQFSQTFAHRRATTLPPWAAVAQFDHFYRLAVNTRVVTAALGAVCVGDAVCIL